MPDYIYLLENRLSADQQHALRQMRDAAREAGMLIFLTGDAVRDLTSGHAVRELEIAVHGNALKLKKTIGKLGGKAWGEDEASRTHYVCFPGTVRVDVVSTHRNEFAKPGKPIFHQASIHDDLRRRDFTVNAMAISLNEGSYGLLMDPLNGAADIETRTLRLVSNYGFLQDPSLLIRATRYRARLGWELDPKTQARYENAKNEGVIEFLSAGTRSQELEQIGHEEEALKVLRALEAEGWMNVLFPAWTSAKADEEKLGKLHELAVELQLQGVHADMSAAQMQLLTAKLTSRELTSLKKQMLRPGFVEEWNSLDALAAKFAKALLSKVNSSPSAGFKLFMSYDPEAILWLGFTSKDAAVRERFNLFLKVWPEARQRIPHALMQELRITQELPAYTEIVQSIFLELIDGRLSTPEEMRAFLEPHSPPAPPPREVIKRPRAKRGAEAKLREHAHEDDEEAVIVHDDDDLDVISGEDEIDLGLSLPKVDLDHEIAVDVESAEDELEAEEHEPVLVPVKHAPKTPAQPKPDKDTLTPAPAPAPQKPAAAAPVTKPVAPKAARTEKPQPVTKPKPAPKPASKPVPKAAPAKGGKTAKLVVKAKAKPVVKVKAKPPVKAKAKQPIKAKAKQPVKAKAKPPVKSSVKPSGKAKAKQPVKAKAKPPVKSSVKPSGKAAARRPVKAAVKAKPAKSALAKGKPAPAKKSKAGKAPAKPSRPAGKKAISKPGKKR
jgi:tRNA nucleotidyltransferase/poly(A) polymerase